MVALTLFAGFGVWERRRSRLATIELDDEGIWSAAKGRAQGFVPWGQIARVRECPGFQRPDLLDRVGRTLLTLEYQLVNFDRLRQLVSQRMASDEQPTLNQRYVSKGASHHLEPLGGVAGFTALPAALPLWFESLLMAALDLLTLAVIVLIVIREYLVTAYRIDREPDPLVLHLPIRCYRLDRSDITDVSIEDLQIEDRRHPYIEIAHKHSRKPASDAQRSSTTTDGRDSRGRDGNGRWSSPQEPEPGSPRHTSGRVGRR